MTVTKKILNSVLFLTLGSIAISALADSNYHQGSSYLSGNLGVSFHDNEKHREAIRDRFKKEGFAGRVAAGYTINKTFSTEVGYGRYHTVGYQYTLLDTPTVRGKVKYRAADVLVKAIFPIGDVVGLYVEGGPAYVMAKNHSTLAGVNKKFWTGEYGLGALVNPTAEGPAQFQIGARRIEGRHGVSHVNFAFVGVNVLLG